MSVLTHLFNLSRQNNLLRCLEISFKVIKCAVFGRPDPTLTIMTSYVHKQEKLVKTRRCGKHVSATFLLTSLQLR